MTSCTFRLQRKGPVPDVNRLGGRGSLIGLSVRSMMSGCCIVELDEFCARKVGANPEFKAAIATRRVCVLGNRILIPHFTRLVLGNGHLFLETLILLFYILILENAAFPFIREGLVFGFGNVIMRKESSGNLRFLLTLFPSLSTSTPLVVRT